jgi:hypothetical protein
VRLLILLHVLVAGTLIIASALAIQALVTVPYWIGGLIGLLFYLLALFFGAAEQDARD